MKTLLIRNRIYEIRGQRVILDFDLAELYSVGTKVLNQAIKRNITRFPKDFMFRLTRKEWESIQLENAGIADNRSQSVTSLQKNNRSQIVTGSQKHRSKALMPNAFTEHGVTMLASVLRSSKAVQMNIAIVRAFITMKEAVAGQNRITKQLKELSDRLGEHDVQLSQIYDTIENLLEEKTEHKKWEERERIGFRIPDKK
ncbi:MAG: ORF6N domain-containing protein [Ferruginibacter sp.]